jgi:branched-chain amino acid aminotransferase
MNLTTENIAIKKTTHSRIDQLAEGLQKFGRVFADHMFVVDYKDGTWQNPEIVPFENLSMSPATSALHYGQAIFEGMKAFKNESGQIMLFRVNDNIARLNRSATRMSMPEIPEELFKAGLFELMKLDRNWIPDSEGGSLYIRPFMFATDEYIGVKTSDNYKFMIFCAPVGSYYNEPVRVKIETHYTRAAKGGVGAAKAAGNYAASLYPAKIGQSKGYHQLVWTDGIEHKYIEESGTMNIMFVIGDTLITPPTSDTILSGITRDSVLTLARSWGMNVEERRISVDEVLETHRNGTLKEMFGTGTAATIAHIQLFNYNEQDYILPNIEERVFSNKVANHLIQIKKGEQNDPFNWVTSLD